MVSMGSDRGGTEGTGRPRCRHRTEWRMAGRAILGRIPRTAVGGWLDPGDAAPRNRPLRPEGAGLRTDTTGGAAGLPEVPFRTATGRSRSTDRVRTPLLICPCPSTPAQGGWSWGGGRRSERLSGLRERRRDRACTTGVEALSLLQLVIPVRFWEGRSGIDKRCPAGDGVWRRRSDVQVRGTSQPAARDCCPGSPLCRSGVGPVVGRMPESAAGPMAAVVCQRTTEEEHHRGRSSGRSGPWHGPWAVRALGTTMRVPEPQAVSVPSDW